MTLGASWSPSQAAATELYNQGSIRLVNSGYLQQATGVNHLPWAKDVPVAGLVPDNSSFHGGTLRVRWSLDLGSKVRLTAHNRLLWSVSAPSQAGATGSGGGSGSMGLIGVGSSVAPDRWLDLDTSFASGPGFALSHDLDRLQLSVETPVADLKIGRQAITWGFASAIPVADVWVQQSPFELDRIEKRGVDAARALLYPRDDIEIDVVVADRGSWADLSAGVRVAYGGDNVEAYVAGAKQWRDLWAAAGATLLADAWKLRVEAAVPWSLDGERGGGSAALPTGLDAARATLGVDHLGGDLMLTAELSWNGPGAASPAGYIAGFSAPAVRRGTAYVVGRVYGALMASWNPLDDWTLSTTALANLRDPSALLAGTVQWKLGQSASLVASLYGGVGAAPDFTDLTAPALGSEFGMMGVIGLMQGVLYF